MALLQSIRPLWVWALLVGIWALASWLQVDLPALEYTQIDH
jgi:hypothetical protein